ncbi:MAG: Na+/H+ antiporter NhaC family protein [Gemmatimonadota bacterium]|nr:Na+/H+ antiporter NhaC family protein [Gemmatimonadota bacterium]
MIRTVALAALALGLASPALPQQDAPAESAPVDTVARDIAAQETDATAVSPDALPDDWAPVEIRAPRVAMSDVPFNVWIVASGVQPGDSVQYRASLPARPAMAAGESLSGWIAGGDSVAVTGLRIADTGAGEITVETTGGFTATESTRVLPGWMSLLPPLVAILLALVFREVVVSLLAGIWLGALFVYDWNPLTALWRTIDKYLVEAVTDPGHAMVLIFTMFLGGMVGVISRNGGTYGIVDAITKRAKGPISGQLSAYLMGLLIFFDDYSNTLIVGSTMRPVTDRLKVSREKLAYIVDSTAAPIASIALISGWIGVEVGLIGDSIAALGLDYEPYVLFVQSIPYRFYPILALFFVLIVIVTDRDFGPMLDAELRARREGKVIADDARPASDLDAEALQPVEGKPRRWVNAVVPIAVVMIVTIGGMWWTGRQSLIGAGETGWSLGDVFGAGDSYVALVWATFLSLAVAVVMTVGQRILSLQDTMDAMVRGMKAMLFAVVILVLAWSLGDITVDVHTADYVVELLTGNLDPRLLPVLVFLGSALISFATGTSWGTMAIMMPVVVPLAVALPGEAGMAEEATLRILLGAISGVLAGSVWGDHCSPISDTTILSSMASSCDHIDHVRTQIPYAVTVGVVAMLIGDIPSAYGLPPWISWVVGAGILLGILYAFGQREDPPAVEEPRTAD